jgi:hypothetical protein
MVPILRRETWRRWSPLHECNIDVVLISIGLQRGTLSVLRFIDILFFSIIFHSLDSSSWSSIFRVLLYLGPVTLLVDSKQLEIDMLHDRDISQNA